MFRLLLLLMLSYLVLMLVTPGIWPRDDWLRIQIPQRRAGTGIEHTAWRFIALCSNNRATGAPPMCSDCDMVFITCHDINFTESRSVLYGNCSQHTPE